MMLIDSNIIIYYLNGEPKVVDFLRENKGSLAISIITFSEVLSAKLSDEMFDEVCQILEENFKVLMIDLNIAKIASKNRQIKKIKLPDAMIGATAMVHDMPLVTRNIKDFIHLPIHVVNPMDHTHD